MAGTEIPHCVAVVVDPTFGDRLLPLAVRIHTWIVGTSVNKTAAESVWRKDGDVHSLERGATTFAASATLRPDEIVASMLETIDLHHGQYSHSPPWSVLEVYGTPPTPVLSTALTDLGFTNISLTPEGFRAWRSLSR